MIYRPKHFSVQELVPEKIYKILSEERILGSFNQKLLQDIDTIRDLFDAKTYINTWAFGGDLECRGFRPHWCVVGAPYSMHRFWNAFDFSIEGIDAEEVRKYILEHQDLFVGIRRMEANTDNWVHIDGLEHNESGILLFNG